MASVSRLKDAIKAKKAPELDNLAANRLTIWKVVRQVAQGAEINQTVEKINFPDPESDDAFDEDGDIQLCVSSETLSNYGLHLPEPKRLHVIVKVTHGPVEDGTHASHGNKRKRNELEQALDLLDISAKHTPPNPPSSN